MLFAVLVQQPQPTDSDQQSNVNTQGNIDVRLVNHTEAVRDQNYSTEDSTQHSYFDNVGLSLEYDDPYYAPAGPTDWTDIEVKKLGRRKPEDEESMTNEVHSYHIDLSAYYASSQTVSTTNLFTIATAVLLVICTIL